MSFIKKYLRIKFFYQATYYIYISLVAWAVIDISTGLWDEINKPNVDLALKNLKKIKNNNKLDCVLFYPESRTIYICGWLNKKRAAETCKYMLSMRNENRSVTLNIMSRGGDWSATTQIIDLISFMPYKVNTIARGKCYYTMIYLLASGTSIRMANRNCFFGMINDNIFDSEYDKVGLKRFKNIAVKTHIELPEFKDSTFYFSSQDALKYKVVDKIIGE